MVSALKFLYQVAKLRLSKISADTIKLCPAGVRTFVAQFRWAVQFYAVVEPDLQIRPWERTVQWSLSLGYLVVFFFREFWYVSEDLPVPSELVWLKICLTISLTFWFGMVAYRTSRATWRANRRLLHVMRVQPVSSASCYAAMLWRNRKPIAAGCAACLVGGVSANDVFAATYGIIPSREIALAVHGYQSWADCWTHLSHPTAYMPPHGWGTAESPQFQDLKSAKAHLEAEVARQQAAKAHLEAEVARQQAAKAHLEAEMARQQQLLKHQAALIEAWKKTPPRK